MKSASKLTMSGAMRQDTNLETSISSSTTTASSASVARAEREIKALKAENGKLKRDLKDVRCLYDQLMTENTHEKFDERRIVMLKSLVIQLERQVLLLSDAISSRTDAIIEVENALILLADKCRGYISLEVEGPDVRVPRADLIQMVHTAESSRIKLYKNIENTSKEKMSRPMIFLNKFLKPTAQEQITLFDVMSGSIDHLNLKEVGKLESKLGQLYKELTCLHEIIDTESETGTTDYSASHLSTSGHTCKVVRERLNSQLLRSCALTKDCCGDLLTLSVLHPSAPWPCLKKKALKEVSVDRVMRCLPALSRGKTGEIHDTVEALLKSFNYKQHMISQQNKSLKEELKFHKAVYNLQISYAESLLNAIKDGYKEFETSTNEVLLEPLRGILDAYSDMKEMGSEGSLKEFLTRMKNSQEHLEDAVKKLSPKDNNSENSPGRNAVSQFGEEFFSEIDRLVRRCQYQRDKTCRERAELRVEQEKIDNELRTYLDEQEIKYQDHHTMSDVDNTALSRQTSGDQADEQSLCVAGAGLEIEDDRHSITDFQKKSGRKNQDKNVDNRPPWDNSIDQPSTDRCAKKQTNKTPRDNMLDGRPPWNSSTDIPAEILSENSSGESPQFSSTFDHDGEAKTLPPKCLPKVRKDRKYIPNTFVPNRTLQLRRSGSLNKLNEKQLSKGSNNDVQVLKQGAFGDSNKEGVDDSVRSESKARSRSRDRDIRSDHKMKIPTKRPFYS